MRRLLALAVLALLSCGSAGAHVLPIPFENIHDFADVHQAALGTVGGRVATVATPPATANIPIASLANGNYPANNWTGFTSPATTASTSSGRKYLQSNPNFPTEQTMAIGTGQWRDQEVTFYFTQGMATVRGSSGGSGVFMSLSLFGGGLRIGTVASIAYTSPQTSSGLILAYFQSNPAACITGWPTDSTHTFTFGMRGFEVYLLIDGQPAYDTCQTTAINPLGEIRYYEYRPAAQSTTGSVSVWAHNGSEGGGVGNQVAANYYALTPLLSNVATNTFDPRDFGMRAISAVTGSMSAGSCTLTLSGARDIRVRDRIIVEIGGESGAGGYNTVGVGGTSPELHYANTTAMNADTTQTNDTYAYIDTTGATYKWDASGAGTWWAQTDPRPPSTYAAGTDYYATFKAPVSLLASVIAVDASPATTLTLKTFGADLNPTCAKVATSGANVYLDAMPSFYPMTTNPYETFVTASTTGSTVYQNMTIPVPAGTWRMSSGALAQSMVPLGRNGLTVSGAGVGSTIFQCPKGTSCEILAGGNQNSSVTFQDFTVSGNLADTGTLWKYLTANKNFPGDYSVAITAGNSASNVLAQRIKCINDTRGCVVLEGTNPQILNSEVVLTVGQRTYFQWQFMLSNCTGGQINGITATGLYLLKSVEAFACNGATVTNVTGTNALISANSSTSSTYSNIDTTITTDAFFNQLSGWLDEPVININRNAFPNTGTTGTLSNWRVIQPGYAQVSSKRTLKTIQIQPGQTDWTITGGYPGGGGCSTTLPGFTDIPNWDGTSGASYGAMAILSDAARTTVTGIRAKGTAISTPGLSGHFGNISLTGANSVANNNVADVIQNNGSGSTSSGNQTNAAYGGC